MENDNFMIRHVRIIDPTEQSDLVGDLLIGRGEIVAVGRFDLERIPEGSRVIDGTGNPPYNWCRRPCKIPTNECCQVAMIHPALDYIR